MKLLIYSLLGLLLAVTAAMLLSGDSGRVVLVYSDYTVQTSVGVFIFMLLISYLLFYLVIRVAFGLIHMPEYFRRWQLSRQHGKSEFYLTHAFLALTEGDWHAAEKLFTRGVRYSSLPLINYLGAAKAAQHLGALERRDHYFKLANTDSVDAAYAVGITQAELHLQQNQTEQAHAILKQLATDRPGKNRIKLLLLETSSGLQDWQPVLALLNEFERKGGLSAHNILARQLQAYAGVLVTAAQSADGSALNTAWDNIPAKLKKEVYLLQTYVTGRLKYADTSDCEPLLRDGIRNKLDPALVRLYGLVQAKNPEKQLAFIEKLLPIHQGDSVLLLTAGRLYKRVSLWGRAKFCLEESLKLQSVPDTCYELATMYQGQGDGVNAGKYFREGLALATTLVPPVIVDVNHRLNQSV